MKKFITIISNIIISIFLLFALNLFTHFTPINTEKYSNNKDDYILNKLDEIETMFREIREYEKSLSLYLQLSNMDNDTLLIPLENINFANFHDIDQKIDYIHHNISKINVVYQNISDNFNIDVINQYPSISPIKAEDFIRISSGFGWRQHPIYKTPLFHGGIDVIAKNNTNIYSTISGRVIKVIYSKYGYGNRILIKSNSGYETLYAHLSDYIYVRNGQFVEKGQLIAKSGNSGTSTGAHLHYEIRKDNQALDPLAFFYTYTTSKLIAQKK